jgi:hypothetical protein
VALRNQNEGFRVKGLWARVCVTFRVQGSYFRVQGSGFRVQGSGFRVQGSGFRVQGAGFKFQGLGLGVGVEDPGVRGLESGNIG